MLKSHIFENHWNSKKNPKSHENIRVGTRKLCYRTSFIDFP